MSTDHNTNAVIPRLVKENIDRKNWHVSIGIQVAKAEKPCVGDPTFFMTYCPSIVKALSKEDFESLKYLDWLSKEYRKIRKTKSRKNKQAPTYERAA